MGKEKLFPPFPMQLFKTVIFSFYSVYKSTENIFQTKQTVREETKVNERHRKPHQKKADFVFLAKTILYFLLFFQVSAELPFPCRISAYDFQIGN